MSGSRDGKGSKPALLEGPRVDLPASHGQAWRSASAGERRGRERAQSRPIGVEIPWPPELTEKSPGEAPLNWHVLAAQSPARALGPVNRGFRTPQRVVSRPKTGSRDDLAHGKAINAAWNSMSLATGSLVVLTFNS